MSVHLQQTVQRAHIKYSSQCTSAVQFIVYIHLQQITQAKYTVDSTQGTHVSTVHSVHLQQTTQATYAVDSTPGYTYSRLSQGTHTVNSTQGTHTVDSIQGTQCRSSLTEIKARVGKLLKKIFIIECDPKNIFGHAHIIDEH